MAIDFSNPDWLKNNRVAGNIFNNYAGGGARSNPEDPFVFNNNTSSQPRNSGLTKQYDQFGNAVGKQNNDYDSIMNAYRDLLNKQGGNSIPGQGSYSPAGYKPTQYNTPDPYNPTAYKPPTDYTPGTLAKPGQYNPSAYNAPDPYRPQDATYKQSDDLTDAISKLKNLTETGGYDAQGIADLRERGISPIRAVYAGAQRDIERQRAIQGGSASYGALKSKMAREMSDKIAGQVTSVNAGIAQNVAGNKLQAAPAYAGVTEGQSNLRNQYGKSNTDEQNRAQVMNIGARNDVNNRNTDLMNSGNLYNIGREDDYNKTMFDEFNRVNNLNTSSANDTSRANTDLFNGAQLRNISAKNDTNNNNTNLFNDAAKFNVENSNEGKKINLEMPYKKAAADNQNTSQIQQILEGMKGLYGTTPALSNLFGSQAMQGAGLQNSINQGNNDNAMQMIMRLMQMLSGGGRN